MSSTTSAQSQVSAAPPTLSSVKNFYKNKNVLITGGSGFLGKVLIWKLIDTCPDIGTIYVMLRPKNNVSAEKRLITLLKAKPFCFKYEYTELLRRVVAIESDITADGLGLSQTDRTLLQDKVNVVFHCAASVRFDASLKDNLRDNLYGARGIADLCNRLPNLNALVHVSTAYSNCQEREIKEELMPLKRDVDSVIQMVEALPDDACEAATLKLLEGRPNTYTYTKALAEHYVARNEGKFPISIVRPSIVISASEEPCKGWVDNVNGIAGLGCLAAIGVLRTIDWNYYATSDMVPVDYVANCLICSAVYVSERSPKKLFINNMTSGNMNPISWGRFFEMLRDEAVETPPTRIVRPIIKSPKYERVNKAEFLLTKFFSELLFAYLVDTILTLIGYKKIMVKITKKMHHGYKILKPFTSNQWDFKSDNVIKMIDSLEQQDRELFKFDMRNFDWLEQANRTWHGARSMLLKEDSSQESIKLARSRQRMASIVHYTGMALIFGSFAMVGYMGLNLVRAF